LPLVIVFDQLQLFALGLHTLLYRPMSHGGLMSETDPHYVMDNLFGTWGGINAWAITTVSMIAVSLGFHARIATVIGVIAYAQLAIGGYINDQGGDRIARTMLLVLLFSGAHRVWSMDHRPTLSKMPAWPLDFMRFIFMMIYINAATAKLFPRPWKWLGGEETAVTYRIETYPMTSSLDAAAWFDHQWFFYAQDIATIVVELSAFLLLTRYRKWWGLFAAPIHIGIALTLSIGTFSYLVLALYPALVWDEWLIRGAKYLTGASPRGSD